MITKFSQGAININIIGLFDLNHIFQIYLRREYIEKKRIIF